MAHASDRMHWLKRFQYSVARQRRRGFTITEILVVIAIMALLLTIVFVYLSSARVKGRDAKRLSHIREAQTALEMYANDQVSDQYPQVDTPALLDLPDDGANNPYIPPEPPDETCTAGTNAYLYRTWSSKTKSADGNLWYTIRFCLGKQAGGNDAGCVFAEPDGLWNAPCDSYNYP